MSVVAIPTGQISDWESFHTVFADILGFPAFYGRTMNAWIDCMTAVDDAGAGLARLTVAPGDVMVLRLEEFSDFEERCPELWRAVLDGVAFVNNRRLALGEKPVLAVMPCDPA